MAGQNSTTLGNLLSQFEDIQLPSTGTNSSTGTPQNKRPSAKLWLNVGIRRNGKLLTLPLGIPLDNLKAKPIPKQPGEFQNIRKGEYQLLELLQQLMSTMNPGETRTVPFEAEIRRVEEHETSEEETVSNPFDLGDFKL